MRYLAVRLHPTAGGFHPVGERLAEEPSVRREAIHHVELLSDGTVVTLAEGTGDRERYEAVMAAEPSVRQFLVSGDERWMATSQFETNDVTRRVLELRRESDLVVETPIRIESDGALRVTYLGTDDAFSDLYAAIEDAEDVDAEVLGTGEYSPDRESLLGSLTARQREVLEAAVEVGYYEEPRAATHEDVADAVGIAPTTAGDHLRTVEARVLGALVR